MKELFSDNDFEQILRHGLDAEKINTQLENFKTGFGFLSIDRAATTGDGIASTGGGEAEKLASLYDSRRDTLTVTKFVPASGAATRMFKDLFAFRDSGELTSKISKIYENIEKFAFYETISQGGEKLDIKAAIDSVIDYGANLPKGLILFHRYPSEVRTAIEEHLVEGAMYASANGIVRIHFTVSPEHQCAFSELVEKVRGKYEKRFSVQYEISYSQQSSSTDTIAVVGDNTPFREKDGSLLFRPSGHGALLKNLNDIDSDIIFIKNIDNVTTDHLKCDTVKYKKAMAGMLLATREKITAFAEQLEQIKATAPETMPLRDAQGAHNCVTSNNDSASEKSNKVCNAGSCGEDQLIVQAENFIRAALFFELPASYNQMDRVRKVDYLLSILDRPIRVCGMVRNEGEPGGGPFWVRRADGSVSLQIGEPSQVSPQQKHMLSEGTHFNPVDVVCCTKDRHGKRYDLSEYTDPATGFISEKTKDGRSLKAQELPGLWNGAMANWTTIFAEVPQSTFSPVKEVADLLRPQHQQ